MRLWEYLKESADYEDGQSVSNIHAIEGHEESESAGQKLPEIPPVSWHDVIRIIGAKLFSVKADMIFAIAFAVTFGLARRWTGLIPVFAAVSATLLVMCALMLRHRAGRSGLLADVGAVCTLLAAFWGSISRWATGYTLLAVQ